MPQPVTSGFDSEGLVSRQQESSKPGLSEEEVLFLVDLLGRIPPGQLDPRVFEALAPKTPQVYVETVFFCMHKGEVKVLLLPRPSDDIAYPGMVHTPGSALRNSDFDSSPVFPPLAAITRVFERELNISMRKATMLNINLPPHFGKGVRGTGVGLVCVFEISHNTFLPEGAYWSSVEELEGNDKFIKEQLSFVLMAAEVFKYSKSKS